MTTPTTAPQVTVWIPGVPRPDEGASVVLFWHYMTGLASSGMRVTAVLLARSDEEVRAATELRGALAPDIDVEVVDAAAAVGGTRLSIKLEDDVVERVQRVAARLDTDVAVCFDLMAAWLVGEADRRVVWLGDLNFQVAWYHGLYAARERPTAALRLPLVAYRTLLWRGIYRRALRGSDRIVVANASSVERLATLGLTAEYQPYPWPVGSFTPPSVREVPQRPSFSFLGNLAALGSRSAFHFLFDELYPRMVERWGRGGFQVSIAGLGDPPPWVDEAIRDRPEIGMVGFVDDLAGFLASHHAMIAPIQVRVGNRSRIVTAMGLGSPIVAHRNARLGNPDLVDGRNCLLAGHADEFVAKMHRLVSEPAVAARLALQAREVYERTFLPSVAVERLADTIREVLQSHRPTSSEGSR